MRRLPALLTLIGITALLCWWPASLPVKAITGNSTVYLPAIRNSGEAKIEVTTELIADTIVAGGDRIWIKFHVRNDGSATTAANTAVNLPFDNKQLDYFTQDIDASRGDRFLGIYQGREVRLEVGRVDPNTAAEVSVWFHIQNDVSDGTKISLRANYTYSGQTHDSNGVSVYVKPPGSVSGFCGPFSGTNGRMTVFPATGGAGAFFTFESDCFEPEEQVVTWLNTPLGIEPLELRATADAGGRVSFQLNSRGFTPGTNYGFVAQGVSSAIQVLGPFIVTPSLAGYSNTMLAPTTSVHMPAPAWPAATATSASAAAPANGGIRGIVTGDAGVPLADVAIIVTNSDGGIVNSGLTDATGAYSFTGLSDGSYTLQFKTDETSSATSAAYAGTVRPVTVLGGVATLDVQLQRGARISGVVTGAGNGPLEDVRVFVFDAQHILIGSTATDAGGTYTTDALPSGSYQLEFDPTLSQVISVTEYLLKEQANITVTAPATTSGVDVALDRNPDLRQYFGRVTAQGSGAPLARVAVIAYSANTGDLADIALTRADGTYESHHLTADVYQLFFLTVFSSNATTRGYISAKLGATVDLIAPGIHTNVDIALAQGASVSGHVTGADTGAGLAGVVVAVRASTSDPIVGLGATDASGNYATSGLPSGTYRVEFAPDFSSVIATAIYQRAAIENVVVTGTNVVPGIDAQLVPDSRKVVRLSLIRGS